MCNGEGNEDDRNKFKRKDIVTHFRRRDGAVGPIWRQIVESDTCICTYARGSTLWPVVIYIYVDDWRR
jgi:hypothetical protein